MSDNLLTVTPADHTTTTNINHPSYPPSAHTGFINWMLAKNDRARKQQAESMTYSPPSPSPSLKRRRMFQADYYSDCDADDEYGSDSGASDAESMTSGTSYNDKESAVPPRKRLCFNLNDSPSLRAGELSSGRSSRSSWTIQTPLDSPRAALRPLELFEIDDEVDVKVFIPFASEVDQPPTSSDDSKASVASSHFTDSEVELKATTQHVLSFSEEEEEEKEEAQYDPGQYHELERVEEWKSEGYVSSYYEEDYEEEEEGEVQYSAGQYKEFERVDEWKSEGHVSGYDEEEYEEYSGEDGYKYENGGDCQNYVPARLMFKPDVKYANDPETYERFIQHHGVNYDSEVEPLAPPPNFYKAMLAHMFGTEGSL